MGGTKEEPHETRPGPSCRLTAAAVVVISLHAAQSMNWRALRNLPKHRDLRVNVEMSVKAILLFRPMTSRWEATGYPTLCLRFARWDRTTDKELNGLLLVFSLRAYFTQLASSVRSVMK